MGDFESRNGLFHFVFANRDTYFLESMVRLNLSDKLYRELRLRKYKNIVFLKEGPSPCVLAAWDRPSFEFCWNAARRRSIMGRFWKAETPEFRGQKVERTEEELRDMIAEARESAFVVDLRLFDEIYRQYPERLRELLDQQPQSRNVIVLLSSVRAADSLPIFCDPASVYRSEDLFPEVCRAFTGERCREGSAFRMLRFALGERCLFYNSLSRYSVRNTARWVLWNRCGIPEEEAEELTERIAAFVYAWYHSAAMRRKYPESLTPNDERRYGELALTLERRLPTIRRDMENWRPEDYPLETDPVNYIREDSPVYLQLKNIRFPEEARGSRAFALWEKLVREYESPRGDSIPEDIFRTLRIAADVMGRAVSEGDWKTCEYAADCLSYGLRTRFLSNEDTRHVWELRRKCIEVSSQRFDMERRIAEKEERIRAWREEWNQLLYDIRRKERNRVSEGELHFDKERALDLNAKIESYQRVLHEDRQESASVRKILNQMEVMISRERFHKEKELEGLLEAGQKAIRKYAEEKDQENQRVNRIRYDLDDLLNGNAETSLDSRFANMVDRVEKEDAEESLTAQKSAARGDASELSERNGEAADFGTRNDAETPGADHSFGEAADFGTRNDAETPGADHSFGDAADFGAQSEAEAPGAGHVFGDGVYPDGQSDEEDFGFGLDFDFGAEPEARVENVDADPGEDPCSGEKEQERTEQPAEFLLPDDLTDMLY